MMEVSLFKISHGCSISSTLLTLKLSSYSCWTSYLKRFLCLTSLWVFFNQQTCSAYFKEASPKMEGWYGNTGPFWKNPMFRVMSWYYWVGLCAEYLFTTTKESWYKSKLVKTSNITLPVVLLKDAPILGFKEVLETKFQHQILEDFHHFFLKAYELNPTWRDPLDDFYLPSCFHNFFREIKYMKETSKISKWLQNAI